MTCVFLRMCLWAWGLLRQRTLCHALFPEMCEALQIKTRSLSGGRLSRRSPLEPCLGPRAGNEEQPCQKDHLEREGDHEEGQGLHLETVQKGGPLNTNGRDTSSASISHTKMLFSCEPRNGPNYTLARFRIMIPAGVMKMMMIIIIFNKISITPPSSSVPLCSPKAASAAATPA